MKLQILIPQYKETDEIIKPLLDSIALVHELGHYSNKKYDDNIHSDFFKETISILCEFLYIDYLKNHGYENSNDIYTQLNLRLSQIKDRLSLCSNYSQLADVYSKTGKITEDNYRKYYNGDYSKIISSFSSMDFDDYKFTYYYVTGVYLAIIMRHKFYEDSNYYQRINEYLSKSDKLDFYKTLEILDIHLDNKEYLELYNSYIDEFMSEMYKSKTL